MPNARVAAAVSGLPDSPAPAPMADFHLHLCRLIGEVTAEEAQLQALFDASTCQFERRRIERAMDDTYDRRNALMMALSTAQARSLGAAAAQMAAACNLFGRLTANQEPDQESERAIERLIQSSTQFVSSEAGLSPPELDGLHSLFEPHLNRWAPKMVAPNLS